MTYYRRTVELVTDPPLPSITFEAGFDGRLRRLWDRIVARSFSGDSSWPPTLDIVLVWEHDKGLFRFQIAGLSDERPYNRPIHAHPALEISATPVHSYAFVGHLYTSFDARAKYALSDAAWLPCLAVLADRIGAVLPAVNTAPFETNNGSESTEFGSLEDFVRLHFPEES